MPEYVGNIDGGQLSGAQEVRGGVLSTPGQLQPSRLQIDAHYYGVSSWNGETGDVTYTAPVTSVNGQTGDVIVTGGVSSINGKTGDVTIDASDVGALPDNTTFVSSFNGQSGSVTYTAPVTSVNSKTGAVTLSASDVGALPSNTTYVSSFNGSTGAITYTAPVTSVNGQTGDVTVTEGLTPLIGAYNNVTPTDVNTAILEGRAVCITMNTFFGLLAFTNFGSASGMNIVLSTTILYINGGFALFELKGDTSADTWHILMGTLAAEFQPEGSVSTPTITCSPTTTSINGITDVGTLPTLTDDVTNETLSFSWTQGSLPTQGAATSVMTGVTATSSTPSFTGTDSYGTVTLIVD